MLEIIKNQVKFDHCSSKLGYRLQKQLTVSIEIIDSFLKWKMLKTIKNQLKFKCSKQVGRLQKQLTVSIEFIDRFFFVFSEKCLKSNSADMKLKCN